MKKKKVFLAIESSHEYGRGILMGISQYVRERNHWQIHLEGRGLYEDYLPWLENWEGDGIIVRSSNKAMTDAIKKVDVPCVELLGDWETYSRHRIPSEVRTDELAVCRLAVRHFYERGIRNIALYSYGKTWWLSDRSDSFEKAAAEFGLDTSQYHERTDRIQSTLPSWSREQEDELVQWLRSMPKPLGLWGATDPMAIRIMNICTDHGFIVPDEISILGTDNDLHFCLMASPKLSSIDLAPEKVGYQGALLLDRKMRGEKIERDGPLLIQPRGVVSRESTNGLAIADPEVVKIIHYIRENAIFGITVQNVLREFEMIPRTLERLVRKYLGRTPEAEIIRVRTEHASSLLRDTTLSVREIAEVSGFRSPEYFVKAFKKEKGISPLRYRNKSNRDGILQEQEGGIL